MIKRRSFLATGAAAGLAAPAHAAGKTSMIELAYFRFRNSLKNERQVTTDFLAQGLLPALKRAGITRMGFFSSLIGGNAPFVLSVTEYPSAAAWEETDDKLSADKEFQKALDSYSEAVAQGYVRIENSLLRSFDSVPALETPAPAKGDASHVFELRVYESNTMKTLARKVKMFDEGEVAIFRKYGLAPVFFGTTLAGRNMPNLTYMVAVQSLADREAAWQRFASSPEWKEMSARPGLSDGEIVSNISNEILRPLPFSPIR